MRRMRYSGKTNTLIKAGIGNIKTITNSNISYIQRQPLRTINLTAWAKFDEINFDGISILATLSDDIKNKTIGLCVATVYSIDQGNSWNETLVGTKSGTFNPNGFVIDFAASELPALQADVTLKILFTAQRLNKTYYHVGYFNHFGSLELMTRNKKKIAFLEITKQDE